MTTYNVKNNNKFITAFNISSSYVNINLTKRHFLHEQF